MARVSYEEYEKRLEQKYSLISVFGIRNIFKDIHILRQARFIGLDTTVVSNLLVDFEQQVENARLTVRQLEVLNYIYEEDMTQEETAEAMKISQQAVSKHIENAIAKIVITGREGVNNDKFQ